ncbi:MAG: hypothetical protein PHY36_03060, partial [Methanocellales archaeon]|nr:hypothetical protein [Methanocellales archaeon]
MERRRAEVRKIVCIMVVALLIFPSIGFLPVFGDVSQQKGAWSDYFDGTNAIAGIAASSNITVANE